MKTVLKYGFVAGPRILGNIFASGSSSQPPPPSPRGYHPGTTPLPSGGYPPTVTPLPAGGYPPNVTPLPAGGYPPTVTPLPAGDYPPNVTPLPAGGYPPTVTPLSAGGYPPSVTPPPSRVTALPPTGYAPQMPSAPPPYEDVVGEGNSTYTGQTISTQPAPFPAVSVDGRYPATPVIAPDDRRPGARLEPQGFHNIFIRPISLTVEARKILAIDTATALAFSDVSLRNVFVRKVYGVLTVQMLFILAGTSFFFFVGPVKTYVHEHHGVWTSAIFLLCVTFLFLLCCFKDNRKRYPGSHTSLTVLTISLSYFAGTLTSHYNTDSALMAEGLTAVVTLSVVIFCCQTNTKFSLWNGALLVTCVVLASTVLAVGVDYFVLQFKHHTVIHWLYAAVFALVLCVDHVYVLGLLMGGERDSPITQHHVLFAAVQLYTNLVCILCDASAFLYLLLLKSCGADAEGRR